eukprot:350156-Chlamydomonas_euryale.AAC.1
MARWGRDLGGCGAWVWRLTRRAVAHWISDLRSEAVRCKPDRRLSACLDPEASFERHYAPQCERS